MSGDLNEPGGPAEPRRFSGTGLVAGMVALGLLSTAGLFWFWQTRTADFLPLADALAERLPGSSPRVEGGRRRRPDPDVTLLQVMLKVSFDPGPGDDERGGADPPPDAAAVLDRVEETVAASAFAGRYDRLEVHLRQDAAGGVMRSATFTRPAP